MRVFKTLIGRILTIGGLLIPSDDSFVTRVQACAHAAYAHVPRDARSVHLGKESQPAWCNAA